VVTSLFLLATSALAEDDLPDSTSFRFPPLVKQSETHSNDTGHFFYSLSGLFTTESNQISNGFGFGISGFYDGLLPFVPKVSIEIVLSSLDIEGLPDAEFIIFSHSLDLTLRGQGGRLCPYAGAGINWRLSRLSLDEPADASISDYGPTTQAREIDMGFGVTPQFSLGLIISVGKKASVLMEGRIMSKFHTADINYRDRLTGDEWKGAVDYDMPSVWLSFGIVRVI
jgi:hypothetical protein